MENIQFSCVQTIPVIRLLNQAMHSFSFQFLHFNSQSLPCSHNISEHKISLKIEYLLHIFKIIWFFVLLFRKSWWNRFFSWIISMSFDSPELCHNISIWSNFCFGFKQNSTNDWLFRKVLALQTFDLSHLNNCVSLLCACRTNSIYLSNSVECLQIEKCSKKSMRDKF